MAAASDENHPTLQAVRALIPKIRAAAGEIERARRLTPEIVDALKAAGVFRMAMPREWGGPEIDLLTQTRIIETLAYADGSVGWCAMINSDGGYFGAFLDQNVAREMFRDLDAPAASSLVFSGEAAAVSGGYRVSGRWPFCSGCQHSQWLVGMCNVVEKGAPRLNAKGYPERRFCYIPITEGEILDTWYTTGLRGSGSNDFAVKELFVPEERSCVVWPEIQRPEPLYAYPLLFAYNLPGVTLGIAQNAIDTFVEAAARKQTTMSNLTGRKVMLREEAYVQSAVAQAEAMVGSARCYMYETLGELWQSLLDGGQPSVRQRARLRIAIVNAHKASVEAVESLYKCHGGASVYASGPFDRCLRDVLTINQHTMNSLKLYETAGKVLLGMELRDPLF